MQVSRRAVMLGGLGLAAGSSVSRAARAAPPSQESAVAAAVDAYIYGYPLVLLDVTRRQLTNVATAGGSRAPMGQLLRLRSYPAVDDHSVAAPNADTLYTYAWLDLGKEPMVVSIPDMADRYFMMPMLSGWSDVFQSPGTRTTGQRPQTYAITGPRWSGRFPAGVTECRSPTDIVWLLGRIYCTGTAEDYAKVHALQDAMSLAPLSHYGKSYRPLPSRIDPSVDMRTPPVQQVNALGVREYFSHLAKLMKTNPPQPGDSAIVEQMASIGLARGRASTPASSARRTGRHWSRSRSWRSSTCSNASRARCPSMDGSTSAQAWPTGATDYLLRAMANMLGPGWNIPADAVYPASEVGPDGKVYDGTKKYVVRFEKGQMPPRTVHGGDARRGEHPP